VGEKEDEEEPLPPEMETPRHRPSILLIFLSVILILLIGGTAFLFLYPDVRKAVISDLVYNVPALEAVFGKDIKHMRAIGMCLPHIRDSYSSQGCHQQAKYISFHLLRS
jgi:hypothetical protein